MNINNIFSNCKLGKKRKRICRGISSGSGKTGGRGHKGQKSRSGYNKNIRFEGGQTPIYRKIPKYGVFKSKKKKTYKIINTNIINNLNLKNININILKKFKIINKNVNRVKIIMKNLINKKIYLENIYVSKNVKNNIESKGGNVKI